MPDMFKPIYDIAKYIVTKVLPHIKTKIIERIVASKWYAKFYGRLPVPESPQRTLTDADVFEMVLRDGYKPNPFKQIF